MEAGECLATSLGCSFFADEAIPDTSFYNVAVSVTDDATGKCVGGENFIVRSLPRKAINVVPERPDFITFLRHHIAQIENQ